MDELKYGKIGEANSRAKAEVIESVSEAEGIDAELVEESISRSAYTVAAVRVEIFVPRQKANQVKNSKKEFDDIQPREDEGN